MDTTRPHAHDFESFARTAAELTWASDSAGVLVADDGRRVTTLELGGSATSLLDVQAALGAAPKRLAFANRVEWSPSATGPLTLAWCLVVVEPGWPPWFLVRRVVEDDLWTLIPPELAPLYAVSTVAGLRAALDGEPVHVGDASSQHLFHPRPTGPRPPLTPDDLR